MSKLPSIIQRRDLEPLLFKAGKIAKQYEKAANCAVSVVNSNCNNSSYQHDFCKHCKNNVTAASKNNCMFLHMKAVNEARLLGGSYIYLCPQGFVFWTSPFYSGERLAGALISGGIKGTIKNSDRIKALAKMMVICADQISRRNTCLDCIKYTAAPAEFENDEKPENDAYSIILERILLANLRRGDNKEAIKILYKLINIRYREVKCDFSVLRLKAIELAVLLSRAASDPNDINDNSILEINYFYLKKIEESSNISEITDILSCFTEKMAEKIFSFHGVRHFPAIRKAERFIWENYTRKLSLREIADVSGLSAPYFSTIFREEMGENLSNYINRLRVDKAAVLLVTTNMPISVIAKTCGFEDQSWFLKIFKNNTGFTPGKYRNQGSISGISA
ncbi:MAG: helix-turn-helix domain-containing protein [Spirochaetes bacterium]|nr:helix-turn-helix domain-containing protein [Spirochaetota bacterium]